MLKKEVNNESQKNRRSRSEFSSPIAFVRGLRFVIALSVWWGNDFPCRFTGGAIQLYVSVRRDHLYPYPSHSHTTGNESRVVVHPLPEHVRGRYHAIVRHNWVCHQSCFAFHNNNFSYKKSARLSLSEKEKSRGGGWYTSVKSSFLHPQQTTAKKQYNHHQPKILTKRQWLKNNSPPLQLDSPSAWLWDIVITFSVEVRS